ncbi:MAG: FAD-dependent oxidoreductase, partial [Dehalococcoidia bacterium]
MTAAPAPGTTPGTTAANAPVEAFDLVVVGAGVGGLTAALVATLEGRRALIIERAPTVGGTSARSSGTVWIPNNPDMVRNGMTGDHAAALEYLDALVGGRAGRDLREAYLAAGPDMLRYLEALTDVRFRPYPAQADYRQELPGAATGWRALEPLPFDGRTLGDRFAEVAPPLPELMLFARLGGMMVTRGEVARLLRLGRSWDALALGLRLVARFARDRMRYRRGTRLVLGNALVARLYRNVIDRGATTWLSTSVVRLVRDGGRVQGLVALRDGREVTVRARDGVVLAGGGFPAGRELRERYLPAPVAQHTAAAEGSTGATLNLALEVGATMGPPGEDNALWFPSSIWTRPDGSTAVYPHIVLDRGKPGLIAVNAAGRRFVNEAVSYHDFTRAMYRAHLETSSIPAMLICDRRFLWRYGLGLIRPHTPFLRKYISGGYLHRSRTLEGLARQINVDPAGLVESVRRHNAFARSGVDEEFGKGQNAYDRGTGDPDHHPNSCIGPIDRPPYYAVAVVPTPLGTSLGLLTNTSAQVMDEAHE